MTPEAGCPSAWVIVLNWNGRTHLSDCLGSLAQVTYPKTKILLVDNGSNDGSTQWVREHYPDVRLIEMGRNLGFTGGNNAGILHALDRGADYVILLNNDTRVEPDVVDRLVEAGEADPAAGVIGGTIRMFYQPDVLNSTGVDLNFWGYGRDRDFAAPSSIQRQAGEVLAVSGCLMAVKRGVFEKIGVLDNRFFAYFEDMDFCLRVWDETKLKVIYAPGAIVYHKFSASTAGACHFKAVLYMRNQYRILLKHFPVIHLWRQGLPFLSHRWKRMWEGKRTLSPEVSWLELGAMTRFTLLLPLIPLLRFGRLLFHGPKRPKRFWRLLVPEAALPRDNFFQPDHSRKVSSATQAAQVSPLGRRVVMGISDHALGGEWSPLDQTSPRNRKLLGRGICFLHAPAGEAYLQIHAFVNPAAPRAALWACVEGSGWAHVSLRPGWTTYHFRICPRSKGGPVAVSLEARDSAGRTLTGSVGVNEVAALSPGDPYLRAGGVL